MTTKIAFLSVEDISLIHQNTLEHEGGSDGVRDWGLLESAIMMPQQTFEGEYLHPTLASMAAAYLFHLAKNHPFVDGNKRVATLATLIFLKVNGINKLPHPNQLRDTVLKVANGSISKEELTFWITRKTKGR